VVRDGPLGELSMKIGRFEVGPGYPCFIVGEVGMAHDGSLALAHAYIDAIADAGANAVKFQCHIAEAESRIDEPWRVVPKYPQDRNRYAYWMRTAFRPDEWAGLADHCDKRQVEFLCSPFSVEAVELLNPLVNAWKVASGEIANPLLQAAIKATGKPVIFSSGMATTDEIRHARKTFPKALMLSCVSEYPAIPKHIEPPSKMYQGLSDHSGTVWPSILYAQKGAQVIEVHVTLARSTHLFDEPSSITPAELKALVKGVRFVQGMPDEVNKNKFAETFLKPLRTLFMGKWERKASA